MEKEEWGDVGCINKEDCPSKPVLTSASELGSCTDRETEARNGTVTDFSTFTGGFADHSLITEMTCLGNDIQRETGAQGQRVPTSPVCQNSDEPAGTMRTTM